MVLVPHNITFISEMFMYLVENISITGFATPCIFVWLLSFADMQLRGYYFFRWTLFNYFWTFPIHYPNNQWKWDNPWLLWLPSASWSSAHLKSSFKFALVCDSWTKLGGRMPLNYIVSYDTLLDTSSYMAFVLDVCLKVCTFLSQ